MSSSAQGLEERVRPYLTGLTESSSPDECVRRMEALDRLLVEWSERLGLTSFEAGEERHRRYFVEALAALPFVPRSGVIVDIGSGGGSPALPLAIALPDTRWILFESRRKKAWFLEEAVSRMPLGNVRVEARRFASGDAGEWTGVTCRGVRVGDGMLREIERSLAPAGCFLWFSSEARLVDAVRSGQTDIWARVAGPVPLHPTAPASGALLVCEKRPGV